MTGTKTFKRVLSLVLSLILFFGSVSYLPTSARAEADGEDVTVSIDKTSLIPGQTPRVNASEGLALEYFLDGETIGTEAPVLTDACLESWITVRGYGAQGEIYEDSAYFSRLPVMYIDTDDGLPVTTKAEYKNGMMRLWSSSGSGKAEYDGKIQIKGRGNTSWNFPKKPYRIKLDKKADLLGMGANKNWVLISNYIDECFLRNKTAYDLARELGLEAMDCTWCDVVINGEYAGNYLLCEHIRIDETRINIFDWESEAKTVAKAIAKAEKKKGNILDQDALEDAMKEDLSWITTGYVEFEGGTYATGKTYDDVFGGFLFELSDEYDEITKFTTESGLKVMLNSPEYLGTNRDIMDLVEQFWNTFERAYRSEDGYADTDDGRVRYTELADIDSMASYWLVMEIMGNVDAVYKSRYAYMNLGSKLKFGPPWDFDWGSGSSVVSFLPTGWKVTRRNQDQCFFNDFVNDPFFLAKASEKYWEIRPYLEELIRDGGSIDGNISYLRESGAADGERWDRSERESRGFVNDAALFKQFMTERVAWLDVQFATDKKLTKSTNSKYTASPFTRADDKLTFDMSGFPDDTLSANAPADGTIAGERDVGISVGVNDANTVSLRVYVNGIYLYSVEVSDGTASFTVAGDCFTEPLGKKNVVFVIGKNADGATTYKNCVTLIGTASPPVIPGDADGDGAITVRDIAIIKKYIASVEGTDIVFENADIDGDGAVTLNDFGALKSLVAST